MPLPHLIEHFISCIVGNVSTRFPSRNEDVFINRAESLLSCSRCRFLKLRWASACFAETVFQVTGRNRDKERGKRQLNLKRVCHSVDICAAELEKVLELKGERKEIYYRKRLDLKERNFYVEGFQKRKWCFKQMMTVVQFWSRPLEVRVSSHSCLKPINLGLSG